MSENALAQQIPQHLQKYVQAKPDMEQFGVLDRRDFSLNFIKVVQAMSPQCRHGWGPTKQEPPLPIGTMFLSRDGTILPINTPFIPLIRTVKYIYWEGRPGAGKLIFMTDDPHDERITSIKGLDFGKDASGKATAPLVTTYVNFYVMIKGCDAPAILPFKRTGMNDGRRLTQDIMMATKGGILPMFALMFKLGQIKEVGEGANTWMAPVIVPCGYSPEPMMDKAEKMCQLAKTLSETASAEEYIQTEEGSHEEPLKQAAPAQTAQASVQSAPATITASAVTPTAVAITPTASAPTPPLQMPAPTAVQAVPEAKTDAASMTAVW